MASPSHAEIRSALGRIVASEAFRNAPQLVGFITFVVEKTLAGEAHGIKGYTIATQALGRPDDFDPQADPIVRVEAGRLRRALDAYYSGPGKADPLRIVIPRGTYVPQFQAAEATPLDEPEPATQEPAEQPEAVLHPPPDDAGAVPPRRGRRRILAGLGLGAAAVWVLGWIGHESITGWLRQAMREPRPRAELRQDADDGRPVIVVAPSEIAGVAPEGFAPEVMRSMVIDGLARFDEIAVVDRSAAQGRLAEDRYTLNLRTTAAPGAWSVVARLTHEPTGKVVWVRSLDPGRRTSKDSLAETDLAHQIATAIAQPSGALFADPRTRPACQAGPAASFKLTPTWPAHP